MYSFFFLSCSAKNLMRYNGNLSRGNLVSQKLKEASPFDIGSTAGHNSNYEKMKAIHFHT